MSNENSFFDLGDSAFGDVSDLNNLLKDSFEGAEDSGEGDTSIFFGNAPVHEEEVFKPQPKVEDVINSTNFDNEIEQLNEESLNDLTELEDNELFVSEPVATEAVTEVFDAVGDNDFDLDDLDTDTLLKMLEEDTDSAEDEIIPLYETVEEVTEEIIPLYEEETVPSPVNKVDEIEEIEEIIPIYETVEDTTDEIIPLYEEETVETPVEEVTPIYDNVDVEETIEEVYEEPVVEVPAPTPAPVFVESVAIPALSEIRRMVEILDTFAEFTDEEKHSTLLLLYSGSIAIEDRAKVLQRILSITEEERETIKTLKELKQLDAVERAFSLMSLNTEIRENVGELVYYISDKEKPRDIDSFGLSRELVKLIEILKPELVGYINSAERIVSI